ncbi:hypothetical protein L7F22_013163 [Adiantum nelumboides]|nr:hypothetical protein [Adiantum nelumboides]
MAPACASKPRIVIIGAGMAGLSAAYHLHLHSPPDSFNLLLLEASSRIGGRIFTTSVAGDQVELGATWIHGIEGSPIYSIAERIGAIDGDKVKQPWERQDGFPCRATFVAEGGLVVPEATIVAAVEAYEKAITEVKGRGSWKDNKTHFLEGSVGSFVQKGLDYFLSQQGLQDLGLQSCDAGLGLGWDVRSLQEAVFHMQEDMERIDSACNSLFDQDLAAEKEYEEFPGVHMTIPGGYTSVLQEMASSLPSGTLQLKKKVNKVYWNHFHPSSASPVVICCEDGSVIEADHVIVTVSLGFLKTVTSQTSTMPINVCRSVDELRGSLPNKDNICQLFEPVLPDWKLESISRLGFGLVDKLFLQVDPSVEERIRSYVELIYRRGAAAHISLVPWWMRRTFSLEPIYEGSLVMVCWFAGAEALEMERLSDEEIIDGVVETMASFELHRGLGDGKSDAEEKRSLRGLFRGVLRSKWGTDPFSKGSYAYVATGASGLDIDNLAEPLPKKSQSHTFLQSDCSLVALPPISRSSSTSLVSSLSLASSSYASSLSSDHDEQDWEDFVGVTVAVEKPLQLLFAGEATHRTLYTTTHGAFLSGVREADRLLRHYNYAK